MLREVQVLGRVSSSGAEYVRQPVVYVFAPVLRSVVEARGALSQVTREWSCSATVLDDARVVLSELMSNGVLHARTELQVGVGLLAGGVLRLEVRDGSSTALLPPPEAHEESSSLLDELSLGEEVASPWGPPPATGRGLSVVQALADAWGWYPDPMGGKVVWAELGRASAPKPLGGEEAESGQAHTLRPVRMIAVPVRLLKASEDHFDDLFRELQMAMLASPRSGGRRKRLSPAHKAPGSVAVALGPLAEKVKSNFAGLRGPTRAAIREAIKRGDRLVDLNLLVDIELPRAFDMADELVDASARAAAAGLLLTEPPGPEVASWRRWARKEIEDQIAGKAPRACPYPVTPLRREASKGDAPELNAARRAALREVHVILRAKTSGVAGGRGLADDAVAARALERILTFLGARRAVVCLLASDRQTVSFGASVGFSQAVSQYWRTFSLSGDLPASECIRTGMALFFRTYAELEERYPIFLSTPAESDPCIACVPLASADAEVIGCLTVGFPRSRDFTGSETSFLLQLAAGLGAYIGSSGNSPGLPGAAPSGMNEDIS